MKKKLNNVSAMALPKFYSILLHYVIESEKYPDNYSCPEYCKVEHKHIINKEKIDELTRNDGIALF